MSYEALIAAQAKRLTKKRERMVTTGWLNGIQLPPPGWGGTGPATYADLYVPSAPETVAVTVPGFSQPVHVREELSHTEWADGYKEWRAKFDANPEWAKAQCALLKRRFFGPPCFAENEI
jgi:hypothetical protein